MTVRLKVARIECKSVGELSIEPKAWIRLEQEMRVWIGKEGPSVDKDADIAVAGDKQSGNDKGHSAKQRGERRGDLGPVHQKPPPALF